MVVRKLFLMGGIAAVSITAKTFVSLSGGKDSLIVLLLQGGAFWEKHLPAYLQPLNCYEMGRYETIVPDEHGNLDLKSALSILRGATGILIGGGDTATYLRLYAQDSIRSLIHERYVEGVPVAGVSAGALISQSACFFAGEDDREDIEAREGLGLLEDHLVCVHFSEQNGLPALMDTMANVKIRNGTGIDDTACAYFENGCFQSALGRFVYRVEMTDFETRSFILKKCKQTGALV